MNSLVKLRETDLLWSFLDFFEKIMENLNNFYINLNIFFSVQIGKIIHQIVLVIVDIMIMVWQIVLSAHINAVRALQIVLIVKVAMGDITKLIF